MRYSYRSLKEIPEDFRPREKLWKYGPSCLSEVELIAIILGSGTKGEDVISLARKISEIGWEKIRKMDIRDIASIKGIGKAKACQIKALAELSERINNPHSAVYIRSPKDVYEFIRDMYDDRKEVLIALYLDINYRVIEKDVIAIGSMNRVFSQPKDILFKAVSTASYGIVIAHNHPRADKLKPSDEDLKFTEKVKKSCELLGFELVDHLIFNNINYISLKNMGFL